MTCAGVWLRGTSSTCSVAEYAEWQVQDVGWECRMRWCWWPCSKTIPLLQTLASLGIWGETLKKSQKCPNFVTKSQNQMWGRKFKTGPSPWKNRVSWLNKSSEGSEEHPKNHPRNGQGPHLSSPILTSLHSCNTWSSFRSLELSAITLGELNKLWPHMGVSWNGGTPKWMVYNGRPYWNVWFGGTPILGNLHIGRNTLLQPSS